MPERNPVETLENICFDGIIDAILTTARNHEAHPRSRPYSQQYRTVDLWLRRMPVTVVDRLIPKMLWHIANRVPRHARMKGLLPVLGLLLQPHISKLDLSALFHMQRMSAAVNAQITTLVSDRVAHMQGLTELQLPAKCSDAVLEVVAKACPNLQVAKLRLSQVTDEGVLLLVRGCTALQLLEVQDCPNVTEQSVLAVLHHCPGLQELHANNLLHTLIHCCRDVGRTFPFSHLTQYSGSGHLARGGLEWLLSATPRLHSLQLCLRNADLPALRCLPSTLRALDLEVTEDYSDPPWSVIGPQLTSLALKCNCVSASQLVNIGRQCRQLQQLHLTTEAITDAHTLPAAIASSNDEATLYPALVNIYLQVYVEELDVSVFELFLPSSVRLEVLWVNAIMEFLTDNFLHRVLVSGVLDRLKRLCLSSDVPINLTLPTVYSVLSRLPALQQLALQSWQVDEDEFRECKKYITENNMMLQLQ